MKKIFITDYIINPDIEKKIFQNEAEIICLNESDENKFPNEISQADGILVWHSKIGETTFKKLEKKIAIIRYGVGYDNIDLKAAKEYGITFANTPDYGVDEVADTACAMILSFIRKVHLYNLKIKKNFGKWQKEVVDINKSFPIKRTSDHKLGIIGLGRIGSLVALKMKNFEMDVGFYDPYKENGYEKVIGIKRYNNLDELKANSSIISINATLTNETANMVNKRFIETLNEGTILINTARGAIIDNLDTLLNGLRTSKLSGVGLDVLPNEPPSDNDDLIRIWRNSNDQLSERIIINPHAGYYSIKSLIEMRTKASSNLLNYLNNKKIMNEIKYKS